MAVKNTSARDKFAPKTNLAVSSIVYPVRLLDECYIWVADGGGSMSEHIVLIQKISVVVVVWKVYHEVIFILIYCL